MRNRQQRKAATASRNRHGYVMPEGINDWYARMAEDPKTPTLGVMLDVVGRDGEPDTAMAASMRQVIEQDGMLARVPTPEEYDFPKAQRKERGYGKGLPARQTGRSSGPVMDQILQEAA